MATLNMTIHCMEYAEPDAFAAACKRALEFTKESIIDRNVNIIVQPRKENGWLEYFIDISDINHRRIIMIAMIQRTASAEYEFCS